MTTADETFTDQEVKVIFGLCSGLPNKEIAQQYGITEDVVRTLMISIYEKADLVNRLELFEFVKATLNGDLRRRRQEG